MGLTLQSVSLLLTAKFLLTSPPVLSVADLSKPFNLEVDASGTDASSVLIQEDDYGVCHLVCYFSKKFLEHQFKYSTIEKPLLC